MIRAYIRDDLPGMFLDIALVQQSDGTPRRILRLGEDGHVDMYRWEELPDPPQGSSITPTIRLSDDMARAIYEALAVHYNGADDVRALRRDYDAERNRVDQLTSSLIGVAHTLAHKGTPEPILTEAQWRRIMGKQ